VQQRTLRLARSAHNEGVGDWRTLSVAVRSAPPAGSPDAARPGSRTPFLNIRERRRGIGCLPPLLLRPYVHDRAISLPHKTTVADHLRWRSRIGVQRMLRSDLAALGEDLHASTT